MSTSNLRFGTKYYWRARARHTADTTQWTPIWNFTTTDYLTHVSPANNATGISLNPTIDWNSLAGITGYQYQYSTDINFTTTNLFTINSSSSQDILVNLSYGTQYYWQVRAFHSIDTSAWSIPWSFTTLYELTIPPTLISPANNAYNISLSGTILEWSSVSGATLYEYQYADNSYFTNPVVSTIAGLNSMTGNLLPDNLYYWKVRALNGSGFSPWSVIWSFSTEFGIEIKDQNADQIFSIYPNPVHDKITIANCDGSQKESHVLIFNMQGQQMMSGQFLNQNKIELDVSALSKGIYLVKIQCKNKVVNKKFVILLK